MEQDYELINHDEKWIESRLIIQTHNDQYEKLYKSIEELKMLNELTNEIVKLQQIDFNKIEKTVDKTKNDAIKSEINLEIAEKSSKTYRYVTIIGTVLSLIAGLTYGFNKNKK
jgi:hypothetical protein